MNLRPYQSRAIDAIRARFQAGKRRVVLVAPCGAGKTVIFSSILAQSVARGRNSIVIAHRKELVDQTVEKLERFGVHAGVVMASDKRFDSGAQVQVCSLPTLHRRIGQRMPPADLIVYDEVHHCMSQTARDVLAAYSNAYVIGATATPWRSDKRGLGDMFDAHVVAATVRELIDQGSLVEYDAFAYDAPDLHDVGLVAGEFNQRDLGLACNTSVLVGKIVDEYRKHAAGRSGLVFPVNVEHSRALVAEFQHAGYRAEHLDYQTPKAERERLIAGLRDGSLTLLSSVGVLTEGFDAPSAEVCILARPTQSLSLCIQMVGRVLRPAPDKERALIHDHAGNLLRHGLPDDERDYSLTATPDKVARMLTCPFCCVVVRKWTETGHCPECGQLCAEPTPETEGGGRDEKDTVEAHSRLDIAAIRRMRETRQKAGLTRDLSDRQLRRVADATRQEKAAEFLRLVDVAKRKNFKRGFIAHQYKETFGVWPQFKDHELLGVTPAENPFLPLPPREAPTDNMPRGVDDTETEAATA